ncbi:DEAD-box ATP-dependent RNA helicase 57 [Hypsizygus marmoreus]|uniref:RNA helicase n=1 Tax=Hypsizygus marmoreus TaxID=39966 RepID=A0A369KC98_HYPMA|nr:DEAD-box ATP-dependent RNA helicase 57 [Hypsizygus marmoreus]
MSAYVIFLLNKHWYTARGKLSLPPNWIGHSLNSPVLNGNLGPKMEAFQLLSRGGANFDKNRFKNDVKLFSKPKAMTPKGKLWSQPLEGELPLELDFFKYAQGGSGKRKTFDTLESGDEPKGKKRKMEEEDVRVDDESDFGLEEAPAIAKQRVTTRGTNVPVHINTFLELKDRYQIPTHIISNLSQHGYTQPTGIQSYGIPILLESRDLAAISPTGTGKTLSYLVPVLASLGTPASSAKSDTGSGVRAIVIAPTRELAHQIYNECLKLAQGRKWRVVLFSKATASTLADKSVRDKVDIIISTPLRLVTSLQSGKLELGNVRHLILDEADRMLDVEFLPQMEEIFASCTHPQIQKAVFSATLPAGAEKIAMGILHDPIRVVVGLKDTPLPLISQSLTYVADDPSKLPSLLTYLAQPYNPPVLIFTSSQPRATSLAEELVLNGIPNVDCLHAGLSQKEREDAVSRMRRGESWVMVSTEVMARGMDFKGVREVINYDFPTSIQSYVHRIGRTGRAGREGKAVTFFTDEDGPFLKSIANVLLQSGSPVPEWILKLPKPSKMKRKTMGKVKRPESINPARRVGRSDAIKKRDMIAGSKRRKDKAETKTSGSKSQVSGVDA